MRRHSSFWRKIFLFGPLMMALAVAGCGSTNETAGEAEAVSQSSDTGDDADFGLVEDSVEEFEEAEEPDGGEAMEDDATEAAASDDKAAVEPAVAQAGADGEIGAAPLTATQQTAADLGRKIIFTADIVVEVDDVATAGREATDAIAQLGGFVFGQQTQGGPEPRSTLTFKVLPEDFEAAVEALGSVGELVSQSVRADDVTERVVDLETRIEVARLGVERLRAALVNSQSLEDYAELERLLLERESELEVMRGSLRTLQDQIDLATITVTLVQDAVNHSMLLNINRYDIHDGGASCPGDIGGEGSIERGTDTTVCLEVINNGDEPLAELTIIDTALGITGADDVITVFGDLDRLEAGQSVMVAHEFTADRTLRLRPKVTARPITIGENGASEPAGPPIDVRSNGYLEVFEPEGDPGFGDGFGAGLSVLSGIWTFLVVSVGFILPLLIPMMLAGAALWFVTRRLGLARSRRRHRSDNGNSPPPPPAAPAPDAPASDTENQELLKPLDE